MTQTNDRISSRFKNSLVMTEQMPDCDPAAQNHKFMPLDAWGQSRLRMPCQDQDKLLKLWICSCRVQPFLWLTLSWDLLVIHFLTEFCMSHSFTMVVFNEAKFRPSWGCCASKTHAWSSIWTHKRLTGLKQLLKSSCWSLSSPLEWMWDQVTFLRHREAGTLSVVRVFSALKRESEQ